MAFQITHVLLWIYYWWSAPMHCPCFVRLVMQWMTKLLHCLKLLANGCSPPSAFPDFFPNGLLDGDFGKLFGWLYKDHFNQQQRALPKIIFFQRNDQGHHLMCVCHSPQCTLENMAGMAWLVPLVSSSTVLDWQQDWSDDCIFLLSFVSVHKSYTSIFFVWFGFWFGWDNPVVSCRVVSCYSSYSYLLPTRSCTRDYPVSPTCVYHNRVYHPRCFPFPPLCWRWRGDGDGMW